MRSRHSIMMVGLLASVACHVGERELPNGYLTPTCDSDVATVPPGADDYVAYIDWLGEATRTYETGLSWGDDASFPALERIELTVGGGEPTILHEAEFASGDSCVGRAYAVHSVQFTSADGDDMGTGTGWAYFKDGELTRWRATLLVDPEGQPFEQRWSDLLGTLGVVTIEKPPSMLFCFDGAWDSGDVSVYAHPLTSESQQPSVQAANGTYSVR